MAATTAPKKRARSKQRSSTHRSQLNGKFTEPMYFDDTGLHSAWKLLRAIIDHSPSIIFLKDLDGRYLLANRAMRAVLGLETSDIVGKTDYELFPRHVADAFRQADRKAIGNRKPIEFQEWAPYNDGDHPHLSVKFPLLDDEGAPYAVGGIATDISKLKQTEAELEQRLRFERLLFELSATLINVSANDVDPKINETLRRLGEFMEVDHCFIDQFSEDKTEFRVTHFWAREDLEPADFLGKVLLNEQVPWYTARILSGRPLIFSRVDELPDEAVLEKEYARNAGINSSAIVPLIVGGDVIGNFGVDAMHGERVWPESFVQGLKIFGEILGNALVRKRAEKNLRAAEREAARNREHLAHLTRVQIMGEMAAGIAHEISQPLAAIENYARACERRLKNKTDDRIKIEELVDKIKTQAHRAGSVITRVRSLVKRQPTNMISVDLNSIIRETVELANMEAQLHDCRLALELACSLPAVVVDPIQIQQVALNLIRNAIEASDAVDGDNEKAVILRTRRSSVNELTVSVSDYGLGITDVEADHMFEPFYSTKRSGLGMGLSLCRTIVQVHGGKLWHSRGPSGETIFHFSLPVEPDE